jgi:lysyl-tRNA synthetase class 2
MSSITPRDPGTFAPTASLAVLQRRAELLRRLRQFFDDRGFWEVETPLLSADSVVDLHLDPLRVTLFDDPRSPHVGRTMWLQTSPEFGMKRLLAAGATAIYQVTRAFRGAERGRLHNPEFTIVEWYRIGDHMPAGMQLLSELAECLLGRGPAEQMTFREAFVTHAGIDPHQATAAELIAVAEHRGLAQSASIRAEDRHAWLDLLLTACVEPHLGVARPTIVYDYPADQAALARVRDEQPPVAERFELYIAGIELANGYHELLDSAVLRERNRCVNQQRAADGKFTLPEDSRLLAAMHHGLPPCTGVALGFDRLVMLALGVNSLSEVVAFPCEIA